MSSEREGGLEEHSAHATHVEGVGKARTVLVLGFGLFDCNMISGYIMCSYLANMSRSCCVHSTLWVCLSKDPNGRIESWNKGKT